ncbi:MAG: P-II family nitrogen regulator [Planctomycetota bacterium]|nr:MAG: P-II family nitrogen regulator [Planctomycetota bacterium]
MKLILAIIQPMKLRAVRDALEAIGVARMTVVDAQGYGRQRGQTATYRGIEYEFDLLRKVMLEICVNDDFVDSTVDTLIRVARTGSSGSIGDGKVFILPCLDAIAVEDSVRGPEAV